MNKKVIITDKAPEAIGAYSQAVNAGNLIFIILALKNVGPLN